MDKKINWVKFISLVIGIGFCIFNGVFFGYGVYRAFNDMLFAFYLTTAIAIFFSSIIIAEYYRK